MYTLFPKLISALLSVLQSTGLRNRVYAMEDRLDILETAIEDIQRINTNSTSPNPLITNICTNVEQHQESLKDYL
jgi:hypothetical protein